MRLVAASARLFQANDGAGTEPYVPVPSVDYYPLDPGLGRRWSDEQVETITVSAELTEHLCQALGEFVNGHTSHIFFT